MKHSKIFLSFKLIALVMSLLFGGSAMANSKFAKTKVATIVAHDFGQITVKFENHDNMSEEKCKSTGYYILPKNHAFFTEIYSGLLSALHTKSAVQGWVNGCTDMRSFSYPTITRVDFY